MLFQQRDAVRQDCEAVRSGDRTDYAWDQPSGSHKLRVCIKDGSAAFRDMTTHEYSLDAVKVAPLLHYITLDKITSHLFQTHQADQIFDPHWYMQLSIGKFGISQPVVHTDRAQNVFMRVHEVHTLPEENISHAQFNIHHAGCLRAGCCCAGASEHQAAADERHCPVDSRQSHLNLASEHVRAQTERLPAE